MADLPTASTWFPTVEGLPGKSAYEIAVDEGFLGSEAQWLATLIGPTGATGAQGDPGPTGASGVVQSVVAGTNITVDITDPANPVVSASGGGGGGTWVLVDSWTHSINVTEVDFTDIPPYSELMIVCDSVSTDLSGVRQLLVSDDNGMTFYTTAGDYKNIPSTGVPSDLSQISIHATSSIGTRSGIVNIELFNLPNVIRPFNSTASSSSRAISAVVGQIDALKFSDSSGGNLTAGSVFVYGR